MDLYGHAFDFPRCARAPDTEYMIAAIPRSGSTYLSMELWRTGRMGSPLEYLNEPFMKFVRGRLAPVCDIDDYWRLLKTARTSPNGTFGWKMFITDYFRCGKLHPEFLTQIVPEKVIFLTRDDIVYQAVSYSKAIRSGKWFHEGRADGRPSFDAAHIKECIETITYQIDFWKRLFEIADADVLHVTYESMLQDIDCVVNDISEFLGVDMAGGDTVEIPHMAIQRNAESAEWVDRYTREVVDA